MEFGCEGGRIPVAGLVPVAGRECCEMESVKWRLNINIFKIFNQDDLMSLLIEI